MMMMMMKYYVYSICSEGLFYISKIISILKII